MSKRKEPKAKNGLYRFMQSLFAHYYDRGMPMDTAKAKMLDETYDTVRSITKAEANIPDHLLVMTMEHSVKSLQQRGYALAQKLEKEKDPKQIDTLRKALQQIKKAVDELNSFIAIYEGDHDGSTKEG